MISSRLCWLALYLVLPSCGAARAAGGPFSLAWQNDQGAAFEHVRQNVTQKPTPLGANVVVAVTQAGLIGKELPQGKSWSYAGVPKSVPVISGDVVVVPKEGGLALLDARHGSVLWSVDVPYSSFVGAGDDGQFTAISVRRDTKSTFLAIDRNGDIVVENALEAEIGVPAALNGFAFVPWGNQFVSAINLRTGEEAGRLLTREQVSRAVLLGGWLYFGEIGVLRFDDAIAAASTNRAHSLHLPATLLPGAPRWQLGGTQNLQRTARTHIQLYAQPAESQGKLSFAAERFASTYFRVVLGLEAKSGALSWVQTLPANVLAGAAASNGFAFCLDNGKVAFFSATDGAAAGGAELGEPVRACTLQLVKLEQRIEARGEPLSEQIAEALASAQPEMATAQAFLLEELGKKTEPNVTKALIDFTINPRTSVNLRRRAGELLSQRRNGAEFMLSALERQYDFLEDVLSAPPVGPIAKALAAMNERRAAPLLARHLNDPANSPVDVESTAAALSKLASASEVPDLKIFFALYRATADEEALLNAVTYVAQALLAVGGNDGRHIVEAALGDPLTHPTIRKKLVGLVQTNG